MIMTTYTTISGDTWDMISYRNYSHEYYIDELVQANPRYLGVSVFQAGVVLQIPEVEPNVNISLPPWKR